MNRKGLLVVAGVVVLGALLFFSMGKSDGPADSGKGAIAGKVSAQTVLPTRRNIHSLPKGSIAGAIVDGKGAPVAGARVCARASSPKLSGEDGHEYNCVMAAANGRYKFVDLVPARYQVGASARGFLAAGYEYEKDDETKFSFKLAEDDDRSDIDITLERGGVEVRGIVKDIGGGTVAGAWVSVSKGMFFGFGFFRNGDSDRSSAVTVSEDDGSFSLWVPEGSIQASSKADGYADGSASAIAPGQFVEIVMTPESVLAGRVVEASSGEGVADVEVSASSGGWRQRGGTARTDADGQFRITRLSPGRYKPSAEMKNGYGVAAESVLLGLGQTQEGIVIEVHPAFVVSGQVLVEGSDIPCEDANVSLSDTKKNRSEWGNYDEEKGMVEFEAVLPGTYKVKARCDGYVSLAEYPAIEVLDADQTGLSWTVKAGEKVVGKVVTSEGAPIAGASISIRTVGGDPRAQRSGGHAESDDDGSFEIEGVLPGTFTVRAKAEDYLRPEDPPKIEVKPGEVTSVDLTLDDGGSLSGTVVDESGEPVKGASIRARSITTGRRGGGRAKARDDGTFQIESMRAGRYRVSASVGGMWGGQALRGLGKGDDDVHGEEADVELGKNVEVRLVVQTQSGIITGIVVDEQGKPVSDAFIDSQRQSQAAGASKGGARQRVRWGASWDSALKLTDMDGRFTLDGLAEGSYTILAYRKGGGEAIVEDVATGADTKLTILTTGSLAGVVKVAGGFPEEFTVSVEDRETGFDRSEEFYRTKGSWTLSDLPAGTYSVQVHAGEGTAEQKGIEVAEGEDKAGIELLLESRVTVTGRLVSLETGDPVSGMRVSVSPLAGGGGFSFSMNEDKEKITDEQGRFTVENAPAGRVTVMSFPLDWSDSDFGWMRFIANIEAGKDSNLGDLRVPKKRLTSKERAGDLGFTLQQQEATVEPEDSESKVALVRADGPALESGLEVGDVIVKIDGHDITGINSYLYWSLARVKPGTIVSLTLARGDTVKITAALPR